MKLAEKIIKLNNDSLNSLGELPKDGLKKKSKKGDKDKQKPVVIVEQD